MKSLDIRLTDKEKRNHVLLCFGLYGIEGKRARKFF